MSDFADADIDELLKVKKDDKSITDRTREALLAEDEVLINTFAVDRQKFAWPEPVRKRYTR